MRQKSGGTGENRVGEDDTADTVIIGLGNLLLNYSQYTGLCMGLGTMPGTMLDGSGANQR